MRKGLLVSAVAVMLVCGLAVMCCAAETKAEKPATAKINGVVKSVDLVKNVLVVTVKGEKDATVEKTFTLTKETKVTEGEAAKTPADLKEGQHVTVTCETGTTATTVVIHAPRTPKAGK